MLSIVTALKDGFEYFGHTLPTVFEQTYQDWEWIIIDDGSVQPLATAFPELGRDPRIRLIRYEASRGQTAGLNEGIALSRGDWIVRMDADDLFNPRRLEETQRTIEQGEPRLIFSDYDVIDERGEFVSGIRYRLPLSSRFFGYLEHKNNPICHPAVAFYKYTPQGELYLYRSDLRNAQDYELWKRMIRDWGPASVHCIPKPLVQYRIVSSSLSGAMAQEQRRELKAIQGGTSHAGVDSRPLEERQRQGMQAFRVLYYRWLGQVLGERHYSEMSLLRDSAGYVDQFPKALFYWGSRPFKTALKRVLLGGVYR